MIEGNTKLERWKNALKNPALLKEAMMNMSPQQQLQAKAVGHLGGAIGLILALIVMLFRGLWYFSLFLAFMIWLQLIDYVGATQRYNATADMMSQMEALAKTDMEEKNEQESTI